MDQERLMESNQEQGVAAWINYLNQMRVNEFVEKLFQQDTNIMNAMESMDTALKGIHGIIESNRGGHNGLHGFIAETAEVGITKAREQIKGNHIECDWVNDNGAVDIIRNGLNIQQKFYQPGDHLSLDAIRVHLEKYPDFLDGGSKYQIPKDQYEKIQELLAMPEDVANKLQTSSGEFSLKQWKYVHEIFNKGELKPEDIEPSKLEYKQVQVNKIDDTLAREKTELKETDHNIRDKAYEESKPNIAEGAKITAISAVIEGGVAFGKEVGKKRKQGTALRDFNSEDWSEVLSASGKGTLKGGIRGASVYILSNYTVTPAFVASAITTAAFGVAEQTHLLRTGEIDEITFINNSELLCLDVSVSALSSLIGQAVIPVPVLGAIIGNNTEDIIEVNGEGKILWDKTVNEGFSIVCNNKPYYMELYTGKNVDDEFDFFKRLHECILTECSKQLETADLLDIFDLIEVDLSREVIADFGDSEYLLYLIQSELSIQFNTRKQLLLKTIYAYVAHSRTIDDGYGISMYGTNNFNLIWEDVCSEVLGNKLQSPLSQLELPIPLVDGYNKNDKLIDVIHKPIWVGIDQNGAIFDKPARKTLIPDIIAVVHREGKIYQFIIMDAKYYSIQLESDMKLRNQPGVEALTKQYLYQLAYKDFLADHGICEIKNCFLMPSDGVAIIEKGIAKMEILSSLGLCDILIRLLPASHMYDLYLNHSKLDVAALNL